MVDVYRSGFRPLICYEYRAYVNRNRYFLIRMMIGVGQPIFHRMVLSLLIFSMSIGTYEVFITDFPYAATPRVELLSPNGGETIRPNSSYQIRWSSTAIAQVRLEYSVNNGTSWNIIAINIPAR